MFGKVQTSLDSGLNYVYSTDYDAANRLVQQKRGGSNNLLMQLSYFAWDTANGNGWLPLPLRQIKAGTVASQTSLLNLRYYTGTNTPKYDAVGNIKKIYDYAFGDSQNRQRTMGSPQTQTFGYDNLDRLTSAQASGETNGIYATETYTYTASTGNLYSKAGVTYYYNDSNHAHAVTSLSNNNTYSYDANGNQVTRYVGGISYSLTYDAENRLVSVSWTESSQSRSMIFVFDGDGNRVKSTLTIASNSTTTSFIGTYYEVTGSAITKYYYVNTTRVAMRTSSGVRYIFGDHLGSTSITADGSGSNPIRQLYKAWGEVRYSSGSLPTKYAYTGQYSYASAGEIGLLYYVARFYDPYLNRWTSPDSIIPDQYDSQSYNRYTYVKNNPIRYNDPSGHVECDIRGCFNTSGQQVRLPTHTAWDLESLCINPKDDVVLTDGGLKAKELYMWARSNRGWWNSNRVDSLTVEQYLGIYLLHEFFRHRKDEVSRYITDVTGYQLFIKNPPKGSNAPYCPGEVCQNGAFNIFSAYQGHGMFPKDNLMLRRFTNMRFKPSEGYTNENLASAADEYGNAIFTDQARYEVGNPNTVPWDWGNKPDGTFQVFDSLNNLN